MLEIVEQNNTSRIKSIELSTAEKSVYDIFVPEGNNYLANGVPIRETIQNCTDINKFITYQKVSKDFSIEYNGELITRINRYYISDKGYSLFKCKVDNEGNRSNYISLLSNYRVTIVNNLDVIKEFPKDINYQYYFIEASKIVQRFQTKQLTLF